MSAETPPARPDVRVDIGMPTRGGGPYIHEALESILAQTFRSWRLVISENGPGSPEVAETLARYVDDPRVEHVTTGADLGMARNHTRLIQTGTAPYVAILHDDDRWDPDFLLRRVRVLDEQPDVGLAFGRYRTIDERGATLASPGVPLAKGVHPPEAMLPILVRSNVIGISTAVVRRDAYAAVGAEFVTDIPMIDYEMWCRLAARFPIAFLDVVDAYWRWHGTQTSQRITGWGDVWLRFYDYLDDILESTPQIDVDRRFLRRQRAVSAFAAAVDALAVNDRDRAWIHFRTGVVSDRRASYHPRAIAILLALPFGRFGTAPLLALRRLSHRARGRIGPLRRAVADRLRRPARVG